MLAENSDVLSNHTFFLFMHLELKVKPQLSLFGLFCGYFSGHAEEPFVCMFHM